jgi:excisionase family DNA binding protein
VDKRWRAHRPDTLEGMAADRFLTLADVAEVLNISVSQTYALVRSGELAAIKIGGRGQWRVEREQLESYIERMYDQTRSFVAAHPVTEEQPEIS